MWCIDDVPYYVVTENIPVSNSLRWIFNHWIPSDDTYPVEGVNWAGKVDDSILPTTAYYSSAEYYPLVSCDGPTPSDFIASFEVEYMNEPLTVKLNGLFNYQPLAIEWDFGDGYTLSNPDGNTVNHTYNKKGEYKVTLTALGGPSADKMQWSTKEEELTVPKKRSVVPVINQFLLLKKK